MDATEVHDYVLRELAKMEEEAMTGVAAAPPPQLLASFVKAQRGIRQWKQETLASFAGVSLTTIERLERGEAVSKVSLDRVAIALGYRAGDLTKPRVPLRAAEIAEKLSEHLELFADRVQVPVRPLRTQPQAAALARCHCYLVDATRLGEPYASDVENLREWLDLTAFVLCEEDSPSLNRQRAVRRRELYAHILEAVHEIERRAYAVALAGTYTAKANVATMPTAEIALIGFFPKRTDPSAVKRRVLFAPELIDLQAAWRSFIDTP